MTEQQVTSQEAYAHAYAYAQWAKAQGFPASTEEEEAYYQELGNVEEVEDAYAKGYFAGVDAQ